MARTQTMVQLTDELLKQLDDEAARRGASRSAVVREAVVAYLTNSKEAEISRQIVEGYQRIPQGTPDEWGDPSELADISLRETLQRLDKEERDAGFGPW